MNAYSSFLCVFAILCPKPHDTFKGIEPFLKGSSWLVLQTLPIACTALTIAGVGFDCTLDSQDPDRPCLTPLYSEGHRTGKTPWAPCQGAALGTILISSQVATGATLA